MGDTILRLDEWLMVSHIKMWRCQEASGFWIRFKGGVEKARMFMEFPVLEEPGEGGGKGGGKFFQISAPFEMPTRQNSVEMIHELSAYMSPQVLLPPALCLPRRSWLEGEASAGPR